MNVQIAPSVTSDPRLHALVGRANRLLEEAVGAASSGLVHATWDSETDEKGRKLLELKISDWTGSAPPARFAPQELEDDWHTRGRMLRLWGDLLQVRSHRQMEAILSAAAEAGAD